MATARLKVKIDHVRLAKLFKKAVAKIEAAPEDSRIDVVAEWTAKVVEECVTVEATIDGVSDV